MSRTPHSAGALTSLDAALAALLDGLAPVVPTVLPLDKAVGRVAAEMRDLARRHPAASVAVVDGWAFRALDLAGASTYSPLPLPVRPTWVEAGDVMPEGCDCVLDADLVDCSSPMAQALAEVAPGQGVRRAGEDMAADRPMTLTGRRLSPADLLVLRSMGVGKVAVRSPRVRVIDVAAASGEKFSTFFIAESVDASGATVAVIDTAARDAASISAALDREASDLLVLVGGTGRGCMDATAEALGARGALLAHHIALHPGQTAAIGRLDGAPVVALPGLPDQAFAGFLALALPVLDRLSGRLARQGATLPLARKISSMVGFSEIALVRRDQNAWIPLAVGDFSLEAMRSADAWLTVPAGSEGYAAGTPVEALPLRDFR